MITHKIKAPTFVSRIVESFRGASPHGYPHQQIQRQQQRSSYSPPAMGGFDKRRFASFVEDVRKKFSIGNWVTYHAVPARSGELPSTYYELIYIQELWYDVAFDGITQEPKVLLLRCLPYPGAGNVDAAPSRIRLLTMEEANLAHLRHQPVQGTA